MGLQTYSHIVVEQMQNHHGLEPAFVVPNFETQQMLVATNQAVMILPKLCRPNDPSCFRAIELEDYNETCTFSAVWRSANPVSYTHLDVYKRQGLGGRLSCGFCCGFGSGFRGTGHGDRLSAAGGQSEGHYKGEQQCCKFFHSDSS